MTRVYFATNRAADASKPGGFGATSVPPDQVLYAAVDVSGTDLSDESSGTLGTLISPQTGSFAPTLLDEILTAGKNWLVFIHGFDNSFEDAIKRAAFNHDWFAAPGGAANDTVVLAFTWPSLGELVENSLDLEAGYKADQAMAGQSGPHIRDFLKAVGFLRTKRQAAQRVFLLAHSMGNFALQAAVTAWFLEGNDEELLFDEVILAGADEEADSFLTADSARLKRLPQLAGRVSVYSSRRDVAMSLSHAVNGAIRLGFDGPAEFPNAYPGDPFQTERFRSIDCTECHDYLAMIPPDATHQYYRRSAKVRSDIVAVMAGAELPSGRSALEAGPFG